MSNDRNPQELSKEEHAKLNAELRQKISDERSLQSKDTAKDLFTALLVLIGIFVLGGGLLVLLPAPINLIALAGLAILWGYLYETKK